MPTTICRSLRSEVHPEPGSNSPKKEFVLYASVETDLSKNNSNELTLICTIQFLRFVSKRPLRFTSESVSIDYSVNPYASSPVVDFCAFRLAE